MIRQVNHKVRSLNRTVKHSLIRGKQSIRSPGKYQNLIRTPIKKHIVDPSTLHFGQQHVTTVDLFEDPSHTVPLEATPHYRHLEGDDGTYETYLRHSWEHKDVENTASSRQSRAEEYDRLVADIETNGIKEPVEYVTRPDGTRLIYSGNHRAAIAHYLDIDLPAVEITQTAFILRNVRSAGSFYGIGNEGIPYASVHHNGETLVQGRRRDIKDRYEAMDAQDIAGKDVVDLGCNIGSNSLLAGADANYVLGVEYDADLVTSAIRLNTLFAYNCEFKCADLSEEQAFGREFDTGFCFSVDKHVGDDEMLAQNIGSSGVDILYFETHRNSDIPSTIEEMVNSIEFREETGTHGSRELYRLEL